MKRKILSKAALLIMGAMMLASNVNAFAADNSNVEIRLNLGSPELYINSQLVTVPAPFSAGEGTTMVPLRVISEAFGAKVDWEAATKTITINNDNSEIKMYVDNTEAVVNNISEQLPASPVIVNGTTMVPLRFISEKFGAEVSFDAQTKSVVVKKAVQQADTSKDTSKNVDVNELLQVNNQEFVGDSNYKWYMKNSSTFSLTDRNFDGTDLTYDDEEDMNSIYIDISNNLPSSYTIDEAIAKEKRYGSVYTIVSQEQSTQDGAECFNIKYKTKNAEIYTKLMLKDNILYDFTAYISTDDDNKNKNVAIDLFNSIKLGVPNADSISDISSLSEAGMRKFEENDLKISMELPTSWNLENEDSDILNEFVFTDSSDEDGDESQITINMYSMENNLSLENWAKRDAEKSVNDFNSKYYSQKMISGKLGEYDYKGYEESIKLEDGNYKSINYYIYGSDYRYRISVDVSEKIYKDKEKYDEIIKCLNTFKFSNPDKAKVGTLYENYIDYAQEDKKTKEVTDSDKIISTKIPVSWSGMSKSYYYSNDMLAYLNLGTVDKALSSEEFKKSLGDGDDYDIIEEKPLSSMFGGKSGVYYKVKSEMAGIAMYSEVYLIYTGNKTAIINIVYSDMNNGKRLRSIINDIVANVKVK